jgi:phosphoglycolate phosphatase-like HAD superfamily hydrolase
MASLAASLLQQRVQVRYKSSFRSTAPLTVFCDFDGPIVDVSERYYSTYCQGLVAVQAAAAAQGGSIPLHRLSKSQFWSMKQERTPDREIAMRSGLQGEQIDFFLQQVSEIVNQPELLHQDTLQPGVRHALSMLHSQGAQLILVTLRRQSQASQWLQSEGLAHLFSQIRGTSDDSFAYVNLAEHKTNLLSSVIAECSWRNPNAIGSSACMIGDTEADILAGQAAGIPTIALTCGIRSQSYLQSFQPTAIHANLIAAVYDLLNTRRLLASVMG